jgi:hypothetical protein
MLTRRAFLGSLMAALAAPRLALPQPPPHFAPMMAPELVAYHTYLTDTFPPVRIRLLLVGEAAVAALKREPTLWSAVMVERPLTAVAHSATMERT